MCVLQSVKYADSCTRQHWSGRTTVRLKGHWVSGYAELHRHANFSFLDGASHPEDLVETAVELGYQALVTDHNGFYEGPPTGRCIGRAFSTTPRLLAAG